LVELEKGLVLGAKKEHVFARAKRQTQVDYFVFGELLRDVAQVDDSRGLLFRVVMVETGFFGIVIVDCICVVVLALILIVGRC
jgi:hypothetical protein